MLRSPTEYESTPLIGHLMQEYFLKLLGGYREFIEVDLPDGDDMPSGPPEPRTGPRLQVQDDGYLRCIRRLLDRRTGWCYHVMMLCALNADFSPVGLTTMDPLQSAWVPFRPSVICGQSSPL